MAEQNEQTSYADALAKVIDKDCIIKTTTGEIEDMEDGIGELSEDIDNALSNARAIIERGEQNEAFVLIRVIDSDDADAADAAPDTAS